MKGCLWVLVVLTVSVFAANIKQKNYTTLLEYYTKQHKEGNRVVGGSPAAVGQFPWQVAVYFARSTGRFFCGGALISDSYVLTAAHCARESLYYSLHFGGITALTDTEEGRVVLNTTTAFVHPDFNPDLLNNDIALIQLPEPIEFNERIQPVALPSNDSDVVGADVAVTVSGWGRTSNDDATISQALNYVELTTISNEECARTYGSNVVISATLCVAGNREHDTCSGDSGGPLVVYDEDGVATHVGVVSFSSAAGCASGLPSGFTRTSAEREWIRETIGV